MVNWQSIDRCPAWLNGIVSIRRSCGKAQTGSQKKWIYLDVGDLNGRSIIVFIRGESRDPVKKEETTGSLCVQANFCERELTNDGKAGQI